MNAVWDWLRSNEFRDWLVVLATVAAAIATAAAAIVAVRVARGAAEQSQQARASVVRDRVAERLVELMQVLEADISSRPAPFRGSAQGRALVNALHAQRGSLGTIWSAYCGGEDLHGWLDSLEEQGQLADRMRGEIRDAIDSIDRLDTPVPHEPRRHWWQGWSVTRT